MNEDLSFVIISLNIMAACLNAAAFGYCLGKFLEKK